MNEQDLKNLLDQTADIEPNPKAKQRAIQAAMAEFEAAQTEPEKNIAQKPQGFLHWLRLTFSSNNSNRRDDMNRQNIFQQKWLLGGVATACVGVFGVMIAFYNPNVLHDPDTQKETYPIKIAPTTNPHQQEQVEEVIVTGARSSLEDTKATQRHGAVLSANIEAADIAQAPQVATMAAPAQEQRKLKPISLKRNIDGFSPNQTQPIGYQQTGRDKFKHFETNPIKLTSEEPVSTFSVDVDTASYSFVRRQLNNGVLPQKDAVRLEEMVNYFDYQYPLPTTKSEPFSRSVTLLDSPWNKHKKLIHIGIKGYDISEQPKSNIVFLLDVSGSMNAPDKLPLVKQSMNLLLSKLRADDTVSIAVYAGAAGTVLEPTKVSEKQKIFAAINRLSAGGSTAGAEGIKLAYQLAESSFKKDAVNRIFLATDGDFNVGITNREELKGFVERKREKGIYLSVLGFGGGNYNDALMQELAQNGNGVAAYIDTLSEAQKVLVHEATSSLFPIAKDVKIQVEFNPATVSEYRLLGYETRALKREDFNNDKVDAGEIGAGHSVTAIYEITPTGSNAKLIDESRYTKQETSEKASNEYAFLKIRYKLPAEDKSKLLTTAIYKNMSSSDTLKREAQFASAVAGFAQLLKDGKYTGDWSYPDAIALAQANKGADEYGYRTEFIQLIRKAELAAGM